MSLCTTFAKNCSVAWSSCIYTCTQLGFGRLGCVSDLAKTVVYNIRYINNKLDIICGSQDGFFNSSSVWAVDKNGDFRLFGLPNGIQLSFLRFIAP